MIHLRPVLKCLKLSRHLFSPWSPWPLHGADTRQQSGLENAQKITPKADRLRVTAEGLATLAGQERIYDSDTFNSWLAAKLDGKKEAAEFFERRFRDEYRTAFAAWMSTDPFNNAQAPPGPIFMPEYHNAKHEQFLGLNKQAADVADQGTKSGETGDQYVRITVLLATVLLITAIGQRFRFKSVRVVFMILASLLLCLPLWQLLVLPRI